MKQLTLLLIIFLAATACASQPGTGYQPPAPQAAQPYAQPTIRVGGQPQTAPGFANQQPNSNATPTLIQQRPALNVATLTPDPAYQNTVLDDAVKAQKLRDDCLALQARESALGWVVNCQLLEDNLKEALRRLEEAQ